MFSKMCLCISNSSSHILVTSNLLLIFALFKTSYKNTFQESIALKLRSGGHKHLKACGTQLFSEIPS